MTKPKVRLGHIELFVPDTAVERVFCTDVLGFEFVKDQPGGFAWLDAWGLEILLRPGEPGPAHDYQTCGTALVAYTRDPVRLLEQAVAAGASAGEPDEAPDCPTFRSPGGVWWQAVDPGAHT